MTFDYIIFLLFTEASPEKEIRSFIAAVLLTLMFFKLYNLAVDLYLEYLRKELRQVIICILEHPFSGKTSVPAEILTGVPMAAGMLKNKKIKDAARMICLMKKGVRLLNERKH